MSVQASVSSPANGTAAILNLLTALLAAGWRVKAWSDATTLTAGVNLSSNPYGSASSGAGNFGNTSAWFRVAAPDGSREWLFQRGSGDATWTVSRSIAGFTGGSPSATTAGTASDATALFSSASLFSATPGRWFISCEDAAPYGFTAFAMTLGGGNVLTFLADEPIMTGTTDPDDTDPYLWEGFYHSGGLGPNATWNNDVPNVAHKIYKRFVGAGSNQLCSYVYASAYNASLGGSAVIVPPTSSTAQLGPTQASKEVPRSIPVCRPGAASTTTGHLGTAARHRWATVFGRANGQTLSDGSLYWVYAFGLWIPWDATTPALS